MTVGIAPLASAVQLPFAAATMTERRPRGMTRIGLSATIPVLPALSARAAIVVDYQMIGEKRLRASHHDQTSSLQSAAYSSLAFCNSDT